MNRTARRKHLKKFKNVKEKYTAEERRTADKILKDDHARQMAEHMAFNRRMRKIL